MIFLLDVNVLIALIDPYHNFHDLAHQWFTADAGKQWASCPLTENGATRILGHHRYPEGPGTPAVAAELVRGLLAHPARHFWADDISLLAGDRVDCTRLTTTGQITDTYLLALASHHQGKLATFDRRLSAVAVEGGDQALHLIA